MRIDIGLNETQSYIDQLEQLLIDIDLLTTLTPNLSAPEQLRRVVTTEAVRDLIKDGTERRDQALLELLAVASKGLGELLLAKPEGWIDEGVGRLLGDLAPLAGGERRWVWVEEMTIDDLTTCARWRPLLEALRRGAEGREVCTPNHVVDRVAQRVDEAVRAEVVYVAERVKVLGVVEQRVVGGVEFGMVYCPAGGFWAGQTQVTEGLWEKVMGWNPRRISRFSPPTPDRCVRDVSWFQCVRFCNKLSDLEGLRRAYLLDETAEVAFTIEGTDGYRLPTAAEAKVFANKLLVAVANRNSEFLLDVHNHRLNDLGLKGVGSSWEWTIQDADRELDKLATCGSQTRGWFMGGSVAVTFRVVRSR